MAEVRAEAKSRARAKGKGKGKVHGPGAKGKGKGKVHGPQDMLEDDLEDTLEEDLEALLSQQEAAFPGRPDCSHRRGGCEKRSLIEVWCKAET